MEDIAGSQDLSLLLAVVLDAWGPVFGKICPDFGITYALVDKVRHIRNDFAHNLGDYNDDAYVADCKKAVDDCSRLFLRMRQRFEVGEGRQGTIVVGDGSASPMPVLSCFGRLAKNLSLPPDSPGGKALREIIVLGDSGQLEAGLRRVEELIALVSESGSLLYMLRGLFYCQLGLFDQAVQDCERAMALGPSSSAPWAVLARCQNRQGNTSRAIVESTRALSSNPGFPSALFERGMAYFLEGNYERALEDMGLVDQLVPEDWEAAYNRARSQFYLGRYQEAITDFDRALAINPNSVDAWHFRGMVYEDLGQQNNALNDYNRALAVDPDYSISLTNRGWILHRNGNIQAAIADYDRAIDVDPSQKFALNNRGVIDVERKKYGSAISYYDRALTVDPAFTLAAENKKIAIQRRRGRRIGVGIAIAGGIIAAWVVLSITLA